ncbi:thiamine phosphate synthase [Parendozoicomonas haliclonae]|uniref:Thiamine-phosphate synthase n=1 Tax=Parendozoicomonas haliclonae TaxID=1960125 RepID=A0A1X7AMN7_9GAMM|nr:thiamine phosphate synthase [Parendozoicomonas haliclonae]SMA49525.1 Thiamine-phosphate synthase [Parendozoicomonas haliclonae]
MSSIETLRGLYGITDTALMPDDDTLIMKVTAAIEGGMTILQYRDKSHDDEKRVRQATRLRELCDQSGTLFLINDDVDLALACGAHGVHLGQSDEALISARERLGGQAIIGITCEDSMELARRANDQGADYIAFGRFFPSLTKPDARPAPLYLLDEAREEFEIPIVAIGGITRDNAPQLVNSGADMLAVVNDLFSPQDSETITLRARDYLSLYHQR